jgi:hypothetical protein
MFPAARPSPAVVTSRRATGSGPVAAAAGVTLLAIILFAIFTAEVAPAPPKIAVAHVPARLEPLLAPAPPPPPPVVEKPERTGRARPSAGGSLPRDPTHGAAAALDAFRASLPADKTRS